MFKQLDLWRPSWWKSGSAGGNSPFFKVLEYLLDDHRGFHTGNDLYRSLTLLTDLNIDMAVRGVSGSFYTLETLKWDKYM